MKDPQYYDARESKHNKASEDIKELIRELGASLPCFSGGTFEHDPMDAILVKATEAIKSMNWDYRSDEQARG